MLCTDFSNPESQRRATACAKMCEDQTTRKTHACSRTATRAVEEKIIVHRLFSVLSSVCPRRWLLCFHSRWSSCGSAFRHHGGTGTLGNLVFSGPRQTPGGFAGPVHLHPITRSVWYHHVLGVTCLASSDSFVCLLTCGIITIARCRISFWSNMACCFYWD